jgi:hypothetical protein
MPDMPEDEPWMCDDCLAESPDSDGGFYVETKYGPVHVNGDPNMPEETLAAVIRVAEFAYENPDAVRARSDALKAEMRALNGRYGDA